MDEKDKKTKKPAPSRSEANAKESSKSSVPLKEVVDDDIPSTITVYKPTTTADSDSVLSLPPHRLGRAPFTRRLAGSWRVIQLEEGDPRQPCRRMAPDRRKPPSEDMWRMKPKMDRRGVEFYMGIYCGLGIVLVIVFVFMIIRYLIVIEVDRQENSALANNSTVEDLGVFLRGNN